MPERKIHDSGGLGPALPERVTYSVSIRLTIDSTQKLVRANPGVFEERPGRSVLEPNGYRPLQGPRTFDWPGSTPVVVDYPLCDRNLQMAFVDRDQESRG